MLTEGTYNFSSGPACLPKPVLQQIREDLPNWHQGMSVMEVSHRSAAFLAVIENATQQLRQLLKIPDSFSILFMHGGAKMQFAAVPLNLFHQEEIVNFLITGYWSKSACQEAEQYVNHCHAIGHAGERNLQAKFLYYTDNETIQGIEFLDAPNVPHGLIADMTSSILTKPIDFEKHDCIFASAQKNLGIAGVTCVIVRNSLLGQAHPLTPTVLNYQVIQESASLYNTPPVFPIYVLGLVVDWVVAQGGISHFQEKAQYLSQQLYEAIDQSDFYQNNVAPKERSRMNVPFTLPNATLEQRFLEVAAAKGLLNLKGHRIVGGIRASIYNAMPPEGVEKLIAFMREFEQAN